MHSKFYSVLISKLHQTQACSVIQLNKYSQDFQESFIYHTLFTFLGILFVKTETARTPCLFHIGLVGSF